MKTVSKVATEIVPSTSFFTYAAYTLRGELQVLEMPILLRSPLRPNYRLRRSPLTFLWTRHQTPKSSQTP